MNYGSDGTLPQNTLISKENKTILVIQVCTAKVVQFPSKNQVRNLSSESYITLDGERILSPTFLNLLHIASFK